MMKQNIHPTVTEQATIVIFEELDFKFLDAFIA